MESRCPGCAAIEQLQEAAESRPKNERIRGVRIVLKRVASAVVGGLQRA